MTAAFCVLISLPALAGLAGIDFERPDGATDARPTLERKETGWRARVDGIRTVSENSYGLREALVLVHALVSVEGLQTSTTPRVLLGRDGWLYLTDEQALDSHRNLRPFPPGIADRFVANLEKQQTWFAARGIDYLLVVAPDKATIAPEGVPERFRPVRPGSRLDQLYTAIDRRGGRVNAIDLRGPLRAARVSGRVYLQSDTHWNARGAWIAYREIIANLRARHPRLAPAHGADEFERSEVRWTKGDLARLLGLAGWRHESAPRWTPRFERMAAGIPSLLPLRDLPLDDHRFVVSASKDTDAPRALVFRDSFGTTPLPLLAEHFSWAHFGWHSSFDVVEGAADRLIADVRPDLVIHLLAERRLMTVDVGVSRATRRTRR